MSFENRVIVVLVLGFGLLWYGERQPAAPAPVAPAVASIDLHSVLVSPSAKEDAATYAGMFAAAADQLEFDGRSKEPQLTRRDQIGVYLDSCAAIGIEGRLQYKPASGEPYPELPKLISAELAKLYTDAGPLSADDRAKAVDLLRKLAEAAKAVANG